MGWAKLEKLRNSISPWAQTVKFCRVVSRGRSSSVRTPARRLPGAQPRDKQNNEALQFLFVSQFGEP